MKKRNGFTLIELLAVILILAVIALISTPIIIGVIDKARKGAYSELIYKTITKKEAYEKERGTEVYSGRPTEWMGKIALMNVSDYGYSAGEECTQTLRNYDNVICKNSNWAYKEYHWWLLTPWSDSSSKVAYLYNSGDGTKSNPYKLIV